MKYDYRAVQLTPEDIRRHEYKQHLGGGSQDWDKRGAFQLALLQWLGLQPNDSLLDFGCGPLRGGVHFIRFLDAHGYVGVDANASFVEAAMRVVEAEGLAGRCPRVEVLEDMNVASLQRSFDFVLCFSVLNHCDAREQQTFLSRAAGMLAPGGRLVITHAAWLDPDRLPRGLSIERSIAKDTDLPPELDPQLWGFNDGLNRRFPIFVLSAGQPPR